MHNGNYNANDDDNNKKNQLTWVFPIINLMISVSNKSNSKNIRKTVLMC